MVLADPMIDIAVLETARGGLIRNGLGVPSVNVAAVINVQSDHLGLKGIDTLEDLAAVKSVVSESVGRRGVSVLNADDPLVRRMARHAGGRVCWFSMGGLEEARRFLRAHISEGGLAVLYEAGTGEIVLHQDGRAAPVCRAADIPATLGGHAAFNVANALAAIAMTHAVGVAPARAGAALAGFASTYEQNPGRLNLHEAHGVRILMDYAHNPDGLRALGDLVRAITPKGGRSIAMLSVPGDRRDAEIVAMGRIGAEYFDRLVFRETPDNRGRPTGEVIRMMSEGAATQGAGPERVQGVVREEDAVAHCLAMARPNDLVVLTPTRIDSVWAQVLAYAPATTAAPSAPAEPILEPAHG
jgi:cyanophycin synthetase